MLSVGQDRVVFWSYPIIKDGLIYVVDLRNGLFILRYLGTFAIEVARIHFLEGNSNLGDALRLGYAVSRPPAGPVAFGVSAGAREMWWGDDQRGHRGGYCRPSGRSWSS